MVMANRIFFSKKYSQIRNKDFGILALKANQNNISYSHFWSFNSLGNAFGEMDFIKFISVKDYLDSPADIDSFLEGVYQGSATLEQRKANKQKELAKQLGKDTDNKLKEVRNG